MKTTSSYLGCRASKRLSTHHVWDGVAKGGLESLVLFSLYVKDVPTPSRHVELALYADDTALIATSAAHCFSSVIWRPISVHWSSVKGTGGLASTFLKALLCYLSVLREATHTVPIYRRIDMVGRNSTKSWVTLDMVYLVGTRHTQRRKEGSSVTGRACPPQLEQRLVRHKKCAAYRRLIRCGMDYVRPIWRFAAPRNVRMLQVLQSKCLRVQTNAPWYVINRQIQAPHTYTSVYPDTT
jgi:hypothetical protein